eukprot:s2089_g8.t1
MRTHARQGASAEPLAVSLAPSSSMPLLQAFLQKQFGLQPWRRRLLGQRARIVSYPTGQGRIILRVLSSSISKDDSVFLQLRYLQERNRLKHALEGNTAPAPARMRKLRAAEDQHNLEAGQEAEAGFAARAYLKIVFDKAFLEALCDKGQDAQTQRRRELACNLRRTARGMTEGARIGRRTLTAIMRRGRFHCNKKRVKEVGKQPSGLAIGLKQLRHMRKSNVRKMPNGFDVFPFLRRWPGHQGAVPKPDQGNDDAADAYFDDLALEGQGLQARVMRDPQLQNAPFLKSAAGADSDGDDTKEDRARLEARLDAALAAGEDGCVGDIPCSQCKQHAHRKHAPSWGRCAHPHRCGLQARHCLHYLWLLPLIPLAAGHASGLRILYFER